MNNINPKKILVVRNDKLGDFVLALPSFSLLKKSFKDCEIHAFVPAYTKDIALLSGFIDKTIIDPGSSASFRQQLNTLLSIKEQNYDAIITLFSTTRIGIFSLLSGIKYRLAPATKIAQIFYNHRLTQRRSRSLKPEFEYNIDVIKKFLSDFNIKSNLSLEPPFLKFNSEEIDTLRNKFYEKYSISKKAKLVFIHPGTGGSANNLSIEQYANLVHQLKFGENYFFVITAGPDEIEYAKSLSKLLVKTPHIIFHSTEGLINFSKHIHICNLFISGSTGPLHIAGALNKPTAAFYQRLRSATPLRWQTLNSSVNRIAFTPPDNANETDMQKIDTTKAAKEIIKFYYASL